MFNINVQEFTACIAIQIYVTEINVVHILSLWLVSLQHHLPVSFTKRY